MCCRPVNEVLQKLALLRQSDTHDGATQEDIDELHELHGEAMARIEELRKVLEGLQERKADKRPVAQHGKAIKDLWAAVQALQGDDQGICHFRGY